MPELSAIISATVAIGAAAYTVGKVTQLVDTIELRAARVSDFDTNHKETNGPPR